MIIEGRKLSVRFYVHGEHEDAPALRVAIRHSWTTAGRS